MTHLKKLLILLLVSSSVFSCLSPEPPTPEIPLTEDEAVEILDAEFQAVAGGVTSNVEDIVSDLIQLVLSGQFCNTQFLDSNSISHQGIFIQTDYSYDYSIYMTCNAFNIPQSATFSTNTNFSLSTANIKSDNTSSFTGNASGLQILSDTVLLDGMYEKTGLQKIDFNDPKSLNSTFTANLSNFKVSKSASQIEAGVLSFEFSGSTTQNGNFSYPGSITFHGNKTATLTLNGSNHPISWN